MFGFMLQICGSFVIRFEIDFFGDKNSALVKFVFQHRSDIAPQTFSLKVDDTYKNFSTRMDKYREKV